MADAGRPSKGDRPKASLTTRIDADLKAWAIAHNLAFSDLLEAAIRGKQRELDHRAPAAIK